MKNFYEQWRDQTKKLEIHINTPHEYPAHFHSGMEIFLLKKGKYALKINGEKTVMQEGCIAVVDSFQIHSYERLSEVGEDCVLIIPYFYLNGNFTGKNRRLKHAVWQDFELCERLFQVLNAYLVGANSQTVQKAGLELFLALLYENKEFSEEKGNNEEELIRKILSYLQENFQGKISREKLSKEFSYAPEHISRVFKRYVGMNLAQYVNALRLNYIENKRNGGDKRTELELLYEAGFQSQQTYYRWKKRERE